MCLFHLGWIRSRAKHFTLWTSTGAALTLPAASFEKCKPDLAEHIPSLKIVIKKKAGMYSTDDKPLWAEIKKNANAAMIGISG